MFFAEPIEDVLTRAGMGRWVILFNLTLQVKDR
jgi:hypothetical protein